jgi:tRNA nucleotidyltransferase (CCA-adding enzyme)
MVTEPNSCGWYSWMHAVQTVARALGPDSALVLVGGAVRDRLLGRPVGDLDLATALMPKEVLRRARNAGLRVIPTGLQHGTVTVLAAERSFEITTFRGDGLYVDGRHPESVRLGVALEEDLARRDFTMNALALPVAALERDDWRSAIIDPFGGIQDLDSRLIRAVGDPGTRFEEDGLRPLRACRFAAQLDFSIEQATLAAIPEHLDVARKVSVERVLVECTKLLCGAAPDLGLHLLASTGLMDLWLPELRPMIGCSQNRHHAWNVWEHALAVVKAVASEPDLRWAALLHDVGKPATRSVDTHGEAHFYGHEAISEKLSVEILSRLKASKALISGVQALVKHHGVYPSQEWSQAAERRFLRRLADDHLSLEKWGGLRLADQLGKGKGEIDVRSEHASLMERLQAHLDAVAPLTVKDLALDGNALMHLVGRKGGPWLGELQHYLLEIVIEHPEKNTLESLQQAAQKWLKT